MRTIALAAGLLAAQAAFAGDMDLARVSFAKGEYERAHEHLLKAVRQDDAEAHEMLAAMYLVGSDLFPGVHRDFSAAALHYERAIRAGRTASLPLYCALVRRGTLHVPGYPLKCSMQGTSAASLDPR
jgi:TPR repeat protein